MKSDIQGQAATAKRPVAGVDRERTNPPRRLRVAVGEKSSTLGLLVETQLRAWSYEVSEIVAVSDLDPHEVLISCPDTSGTLRIFQEPPPRGVIARSLQDLQCSILAGDVSPLEFRAGVESLLGGARVWSPAIAAMLAVAATDRGKLTRREEEVARLVVRGLSNREIAGALGISPHTVRTHLQTIARTLGVNSRDKLAALMAG